MDSLFFYDAYSSSNSGSEENYGLSFGPSSSSESLSSASRTHTDSDSSSDSDSDNSSNSESIASENRSADGSSGHGVSQNCTGISTVLPNENITASLNPRKEKARLNLKACMTNTEENDDGLTCSICLKSCKISGAHRLCSLKCGHLFGESCLRQRLKEATLGKSSHNSCPECKIRARLHHIRYIYAKRLSAVDRSEEIRVRELLNQERMKAQILEFELDSLRTSYVQRTQKIQSLESTNESLKQFLLRNDIPSTYNKHSSKGKDNTTSLKHKLTLDRNITIAKKASCRIMKYDDRRSKLIIAQKGFFPGYGLRILNAPTFETSNYLYTSQRMVCDISLSPGENQNLIAVASKERTSKLFDIHNFQSVTVFKPGKEPITSCAISSLVNENKIFLGSNHGSLYVYDIRNPGTCLMECKTKDNNNFPVVQIETVPECELFPRGGLLICKQSSLWFFENQKLNETEVQMTCLMSEDNLISISYNNSNRSLLVQAGTSDSQTRSRHILGYLSKSDNVPILQIDVIFYALTTNPVMVKSTQIQINSNILIAAYMQDPKLLVLYDKNSEQCIQSYPMPKLVYDLCPIYTNDCTYLATLHKSKCLLYKVAASS
ncbi:E3 ubiquitin-protein ligase RFWD3-like [Haematobia irritans]|uniref:E3 ubiquitin-protein ligase RFWD3-like n=1 Tax=Haematobia irritans TaxID=7368 RepID=UPI003F50865C